jgi:two-component system OmpR family response regulator
MTKHILVADDDAHIREVIRFALEKAGMRVTMAGDGREALARFGDTPVDLVVLDINMPELDGLEVCRAIRKTSELPVLFLSSRDDEIDRLLGLEIGGDDYVTKPFSPRELVARINAILKRGGQGVMVTTTPPKLEQGNLAICPDQHSASWAGQGVALTATEFSIVLLLASQPSRVYSRDSIMAKAYDHNVYVSDRTIDSHIRHIRQKFAEVGCPALIETVHGVGYKLNLCP